MGTNIELNIDGQYLSERGIVVLEYVQPALSSYKDGGGVSIENMDGLASSGVLALNAPRGKLTICYETENELQAHEKRRELIAWFRQVEYRKITSNSDYEYYRYVKLLQQASDPIIRHQWNGYVYCELSFVLQFKDPFQYGKKPKLYSTKLSNINTTSMQSSNLGYVDFGYKGTRTRNFRILFDVLGYDSFEFSYLKLELYRTVEKDGRLVRVNERPQTLLFDTLPWSYGFSTKNGIGYIDMKTAECKMYSYEMIQSYTSGMFFQIREGTYQLAIEFRSKAIGNPSVVCPCEVSVEVVSQYE